MKQYLPIILMLFPVAAITSCSPSDAVIATAIAETQVIEDHIATAIVQTQQAQATSTSTSTQMPTPTIGVGTTRISEKDGMPLMYVPAGVFWMGSAEDDPESDDDEHPLHEVILHAFWIDKTEVTNAMYVAFLNSNGNQIEGGETWLDVDDEGVFIENVNGEWRSKSGYENHPAVEVTWFGAVAYCQWAGRYLPTESEWEKAARGPEGRIYPWGDEFDTSLANVDDETIFDDYAVECDRSGCDGFDRTAPVGSFPDAASLYGALDMAGNVWEWVADLYSEDFYYRSPAEDPIGPSSGDSRTYRGGSFLNSPKYVRSANRGNSSPDHSANGLGFRCAWSEDAPQLIQVTPMPSPTNLPASETPKPTTAASPGAISGSLMYPSEWIPAMRIVAFEKDGDNWYSTTTQTNASSYTITDVPPGIYHVVAYNLEFDISGGFTMAVTCGLTDGCNDHALVDIVVVAGQTTRGIDPWDWYAPDGAYPENPDP